MMISMHLNWGSVRSKPHTMWASGASNRPEPGSTWWGGFRARYGIEAAEVVKLVPNLSYKLSDLHLGFYGWIE